MIDYTVYKFIHFLGIIMIFVSLGGVMVHVFNGGAKADNIWRKPAGITHGIGLFLVLLGGFGMMARLGIQWPWPGWLFVKLADLGRAGRYHGSPVPSRRQRQEPVGRGDAARRCCRLHGHHETAVGPSAGASVRPPTLARQFHGSRQNRHYKA